jgi:hypothetical protein
VRLHGAESDSLSPFRFFSSTFVLIPHGSPVFIQLTSNHLAAKVPPDLFTISLRACAKYFQRKSVCT